MIYKIFLLLAFLFVLNGVCVAQDSLNKVMQVQKAPLNKYQYELDQRYRLILIEKLAQNDVIKLQIELNYIITREKQKKTTYLSIEEKIPLFYITNQIDSIHTIAFHKQLEKGFYPNYESDFRAADNPINLLNYKLRIYLHTHLAIIQEHIKQAKLTEEEKDFHLLNLEYFTYSSRNIVRAKYTNDQKEVNKIANTFLQKYPLSIYNPYIKKCIRNEYVLSNWASAGSFCVGYNTFTQNLGQKFSDMGYFGFAYEHYYKKIFISISLNTYIWGEVKENINYNSGAIWQKNASAKMGDVPLVAGFILFDTDRIRVLPFAGISLSGIYPGDKESKVSPNNKAVSIDSWNSMVVGLNFDYKLFAGKDVDNDYYGAWRIRMAYTQPNFSSYSPNFNGQMYAISLGFFIFDRNIKRIK